MQAVKEGRELRYTEVECKTALSVSRLPGFDYALNPYKNCEHGCKYCYAPNVLRVPRKDWGAFVEIRRNIPKVLANELKVKKRGVVGISTATDPYQPLEEKFKLTRYCLEQLMRHDFSVSILTKSFLVTRDIDIISRFSDAEVGFTITTIHDQDRKLLEPKASSIENRLTALEEVSKKGINTYAFLGPLYPTMKEEELSKLIEMIKSAGAKKIMADRLNLKPGVWASVYNALEENKAERNIWKDALFGGSKPYDKLFNHLRKTCIHMEIEFEIQGY